MSSLTRIDGVNKELNGGLVCVGGVNKEIVGGLACIDGVNRELNIGEFDYTNALWRENKYQSTSSVYTYPFLYYGDSGTPVTVENEYITVGENLSVTNATVHLFITHFADEVDFTGYSKVEVVFSVPKTPINYGYFNIMIAGTDTTSKEFIGGNYTERTEVSNANVQYTATLDVTNINEKGYIETLYRTGSTASKGANGQQHIYSVKLIK